MAMARVLLLAALFFVTVPTTGGFVVLRSTSAGVRITAPKLGEMQRRVVVPKLGEVQRAADMLRQAKDDASKAMNASWKNSNISMRTHQEDKSDRKQWTFQSFYAAHTTGKGLWKWNNALNAYQRHLGPRAGQTLALAEVGVQSGGSIDMWKAVLGPNMHYFGIDINTACNKFTDATTTIMIGDQTDMRMWDSFYSTLAPKLDVLVDDGGHSPEQMGMTFWRAFEHINPGGFIVTEDIFNEGHVWSYLFNVAKCVGWWQRQVESVHLYPGLLILKKAATRGKGDFMDTLLPWKVTVDSWEAMWAEIPLHPGETIAVQNQQWGSMLSEVSMRSIFHQFSQLYAGNVVDMPTGCAVTFSSICTTKVINTPVQNTLLGVHAFQDTLFVEVAASPPIISADRRGTEWIPY
mmetsp:Transcript_17983/g.35175  ORF Transcript_17983/g.35175 Transcript_17983/m.35175 type:complete len:406 (-) Transcript_17983:50-1267(-)